MLEPLRWLLTKLESDPPIVTYDERQGDQTAFIDALIRRGLLCERPSAGSFTCSECGYRGRVEYVQDSQSLRRHGFLTCPSCGPVEVPADSLQRWIVDVPFLIRGTFASVNLAPHEVAPRRLWHLGKARWAGRTREVYFGLGTVRASGIQGTELATRPKTILFTPLESTASTLKARASNFVLSLERVAHIEGDMPVLDIGVVEARLTDAEPVGSTSSRTPPRKRGSRTAGIDALTNYMIEHLRIARDHAHATALVSEAPQLLPRPKQSELARALKMNPGTVSRCFRDRAAKELNIYYDAANDVQTVLAWRGPISKGRRH